MTNYIGYGALIFAILVLVWVIRVHLAQITTLTDRLMARDYQEYKVFESIPQAQPLTDDMPKEETRTPPEMRESDLLQVQELGEKFERLSVGRLTP